MGMVRSVGRSVTPVLLGALALVATVSSCGGGPATTRSEEAGGAGLDATADAVGMQDSFTVDSTNPADTAGDSIGVEDAADDGSEASADAADAGATSDAGGDSESGVSDSSTSEDGAIDAGAEAAVEAGPCSVD